MAHLGGDAHVSTTRRTLVRGAAWTVPVVAAFATAPAYAASTCASPKTYTLDWGTTPYNHTGNTSYATLVSGGTTIYAHFSTTFRGNGKGDGNIPNSTETRNLSVPRGPARTAPRIPSSLTWEASGLASGASACSRSALRVMTTGRT